MAATRMRLKPFHVLLGPHERFEAPGFAGRIRDLPDQESSDCPVTRSVPSPAARAGVSLRDLHTTIWERSARQVRRESVLNGPMLMIGRNQGSLPPAPSATPTGVAGGAWGAISINSFTLFKMTHSSARGSWVRACPPKRDFQMGAKIRFRNMGSAPKRKRFFAAYHDYRFKLHSKSAIPPAHGVCCSKMHQFTQTDLRHLCFSFELEAKPNQDPAIPHWS